MRRQQIEKEFKKKDGELRNSKPSFTPYPFNIIKKREFLLFAQVHLNNIVDAKFKRDKWEEKFETEMYDKVMEIYYNWN